MDEVYQFWGQVTVGLMILLGLYYVATALYSVASFLWRRLKGFAAR